MASAADPRQIFLEEAAELLVQLEATLLQLEASPGDGELIGTAFRALHTLKGSGAMFGFDAAAAFTHHIENAFELVRQGRLPPTPELVGIALGAKDRIQALIEAPETADRAAGDALLEALAALVGSAPAAATAEDDPATTAGRGWRVRFSLAPDTIGRGTNPLLLLDELRGLGPCRVVASCDALPPLAEMDPEGCYLAWTVEVETDQPAAAVEDVFIFVIDEMTLDITPLGSGTRTPDTIAVAPLAATPLAETPTAAAPPAARGDGPARAAAPAIGSIRVPAERLDDLMDQVGELVIAQARLKQLIAGSGNADIAAVAEEIERLSGGLRDTTMGIRMVPIGSLFERFHRLVRDLSQSLGKSVRLTLSGEETELDKTVIERLNDPLVHIIRNSLDHGVETAEARVRSGKDPQGHIHLSARHSGAKVLVTIRDDGRGIDRDRVRAKAEEQGLIEPGAAIADAELLQLIFHPGFSTAAAITSVSGRGVGMDVVKRVLDSLRGSIDVSSTPGGGTEITLSLPLTLAIIDGLLVRVGLGRYVIPLSAVEECVELPADADQRHRGRNFLGIRGELVPFIRLRETFRATSPADPFQKAVIVSTGERRVGLVVDQVIGDHQTVIKSLSKLHADVAAFSGATILGDGSVALILDVGHLIAAGQADRPRLAS